MCGICGFSGAKNQDILRKMGNSIIHRGPDDDGYYLDGSMNLCSRRLSIVDLNTGRQPVHNEDKSIWVVLNGEIYNHADLRMELKKRGHHFYTDHSDTEVLVHMYEEYGLPFLQRLNGMYAFAIWDISKGKLILARDRMGVKPLFYTVVNNEILFSSEIKAFFCYPKYKKMINNTALYHYFSFKNIIAPETAFKNVYELLPGCYAIWDGGKITCTKYWNIDFSKKSRDGFDEAREKIRDILVDAVKIRIPEDVGMGTFLSGGLDSGLVTAISAQYMGDRLKTFSLCYPERSGSVYRKDQDEIYAKRISEQFHTDHHKYVLSAGDMIREIPNVVKAFDQPFSGAISTYYLSSEISKYVKVACSGDGADELFGSYLLHRLAVPFGRYSEARLQGKSMKDSFDGLGISGGEFSDSYLEELLHKSLGKISGLAYELLQIDDGDKSNLLSPEFLEMISPDVSSRNVVDSFFSSSTADEYMNMALEYDWNNLLPNQILPFTDFLSMAHSLEIRSPFLDYRLVEYTASLPGEYKINGGVTKRILKEVARDYLDDGIIDRPKEGFVQPTYDWLQDELKEYALDVLSEESIKKYGVLNEKYVEGILRTYYSDPMANIRTSQLIWNLIMFHQWCEVYW